MKRSIILSVLSFVVIIVMSGCPNNGEASFTISLDDLIFQEAGEGYTRRPPRLVRVTNTGNSSLSASIALGGSGSGDFALSTSSLNIAAGAFGDFTVVPRMGLLEGTHSATVTVSATGATEQSFNVSFTVTEAVEEFHVFLAFGQSNLQGPGVIRAEDRAGVSERWRVMNVVAGTYAGVAQVPGTWYTAVPPLIIPDSGLNHWTGTFTIGLGPLDWFGRTLVENTTDNVTIGVIAVANGDLALASFHRTRAVEYFAPGSGGDGRENNRPSDTERSGWNRYRSAGYESLYHAIITNARIAQEGGGVIKGIIVHQGESGRGLTYTSWHEMLREIYNDMLADLGLAPNSVPILLGQLWNAGTGPGGYLNIDNRIQNVIPNAWVISTEGLTDGRVGQGQPDNIHFGSYDLERLGRRYAEKMLDLIYR